jgi:broad specificity phosphatase PhoE
MILIRHAEKQYRNAEAEIHKHDPGLKEIGVERAKKVAVKLIELFGEPSRIFSSPYRRTRETALVMNSVLRKPFEEIHIDNNLSEYLGNHSNVPLDVTEATRIHDPPHPESFEDLKKRSKKSLEKMRRYFQENHKKYIWCVTHGLIIKQIASLLGVKISKTLPCLSCLVIHERSEFISAQFILFRGDLKPEKESEESTKKISLSKSNDKKSKVRQSSDSDSSQIKPAKPFIVTKILQNPARINK